MIINYLFNLIIILLIINIEIILKKKKILGLESGCTRRIIISIKKYQHICKRVKWMNKKK
jgi:hypothetical protein